MNAIYKLNVLDQIKNQFFDLKSIIYKKIYRFICNIYKVLIGYEIYIQNDMFNQIKHIYF